MKKIYKVYYLAIGFNYNEHFTKYFENEIQALNYWCSLIPNKIEDLNGLVDVDHELKSITVYEGYDYIELETIKLDDEDDKDE